MDEQLRIQPESLKKKDKEENLVDIYVSPESLRIYDNPWMEGMTPKIPRPAETQHPGMFKSENTQHRFSLYFSYFYVHAHIISTIFCEVWYFIN